MTQRKAGWVVSGLLITVGALALSACSVAGLGAAKPTPTPDAKTILANVQKVKYTDMTFKMTFSGSSSGTIVSGDASGVLTMSPKRVKITLNLNSGGQQVALDMIEDIDGKTVYLKFNTALVPGLPTDKWIKSDASGSLSSLSSAFDASQVTGFDQLSNATLKGSETVDGVPVWHLTGTESISGTTSTVDLYIRRDNNYPYKVVSHATGSTAADATITFTGINTGATVDLPPADQVVVEPTP